MNKLNVSIYDTMLPEIIQRIALNLEYDDIINNCKTSKIFNNNICRNKHFWKLKKLQDAPNTIFNKSWKKTYKISLQKLYTFGKGEEGRHGHGNYNDLNIPTLVKGLENVTFVSCGEDHKAVISNGLLYTFGNGVIGKLANVTVVSCGYHHTEVIACQKCFYFIKT